MNFILYLFAFWNFWLFQTNQGARKKNCNLSGPWHPPPPAVSGHIDFIQVFFFTFINIYVFGERKAWNGWFWKKNFNILRKYWGKCFLTLNFTNYFCIFFCFRIFKHFFLFWEKKLAFFSGGGRGSGLKQTTPQKIHIFIIIFRSKKQNHVWQGGNLTWFWDIWFFFVA